VGKTVTQHAPEPWLAARLTLQVWISPSMSRSRRGPPQPALFALRSGCPFARLRSALGLRVDKALTMDG
jgi:hypothetical protein